jgi:putative ABC transport system permease protein
MIALGPIYSSLKKNSLGALLIGLQIAVTLAILANAMHIIQARLATLQAPSGLVEDNLFTFTIQTATAPDAQPAERVADLAKLRAIPGVSSAYATNTVPLTQSGWSMGISASRGANARGYGAAIYFGDEQMIATLGGQLVAGRNFTPAEVTTRGPNERSWPPNIIITEELAKSLYGTEAAVGKTAYIGDSESPDAKPSTVIGVIKDIRTPWSGWNQDWLSSVVLVPQSLPGSGRMAVRTLPGEMASAMNKIQDTMLEVNRERVIDEPRTFAETRADFYRSDTAMITMLVAVIVALAMITAFGIFGMVSFWVTQRRKQIGTRRALGATKGDILLHFMTENFLIVSIGILLGWALAIGLNVWLARSFEMERLGFGWILLGSVGVYLVGQLATLKPARDAASVPPVVATRA